MVTFHGNVADNGPENRTPPSADRDPPPPAPQAASQGNSPPRPDPPALEGLGANGPDKGVWIPPPKQRPTWPGKGSSEERSLCATSRPPPQPSADGEVDTSIKRRLTDHGDHRPRAPGEPRFSRAICGRSYASSGNVAGVPPTSTCGRSCVPADVADRKSVV